MRPREVLPGENQWFPFSRDEIMAVVPAHFRGVYLIADSEGTPIYAGEAHRLRDALMRHARGQSEEAACLRSHGATQFLFTVIRASRKDREKEHRELLDFYRPPCNGTGA